MNILISGGTGFLGSAFSQWVQTQADVTISTTWLTRDTSQAHPSCVDMMSYDELKTTDKTFDVIINLAGAGIADSRWTDERKRQLFDSRIKPTQAIIEFISRTAVRPKLLVSGSAIGWYGVQGDKPLDESSGFESDFAHKLCQTWENEASIATGMGVPVVILRTGVVIDPAGGMIGKLLTPFKMGAGGKLGNGKQIMSWISRTDWVRAAWFVIQKHLQLFQSQAQDDGETNKPTMQDAKVTIYNFTAPTPVSNLEFTKAMGSWLGRPTVMAMPEFVLKTMFGEMATLLIDGQKVLPKALLDAGFEFKHLTIEQALQEQSKP